MTSVSDLYVLYLKPHHLPASGYNVTITQVTVEELHPRPGSEEVERKLVLAFKNATRRLIVNQTQANRLVDLLGEDYTAWVGQVVFLAGVKLNNKTQTVQVGPARNGNSKGG
jgi:hypothetical protein